MRVSHRVAQVHKPPAKTVVAGARERIATGLVAGVNHAVGEGRAEVVPIIIGAAAARVGGHPIAHSRRERHRRDQRRVCPGAWRAGNRLARYQGAGVRPDGHLRAPVMTHMRHGNVRVGRERISQSIVPTAGERMHHVPENPVGDRPTEQAAECHRPRKIGHSVTKIVPGRDRHVKGLADELR